MGGASQLGQPTFGGQLGQIAQSMNPPAPAAAPTQNPPSAAPAPGGMTPAPPLTMQPQPTPQPQSGATMGGGALSSVSAPNQAKNPGASQAKLGGS